MDRMGGKCIAPIKSAILLVLLTGVVVVVLVVASTSSSNKRRGSGGSGKSIAAALTAFISFLDYRGYFYSRGFYPIHLHTIHPQIVHNHHPTSSNKT